MTDDFYCDEVLSGKTKVKVVEETKRVLAYYHTKPFWPVHIVVFPKEHIASLLTLDDPSLLEELFEVIKKVADKVNKKNGSCRVLSNLGKYQDSKHLHWHVSSGEPL